MFHGKKSRPQHSSQFQNNGASPSDPLQNMGNPGSFMQNPMQIQHQMAIPNNNSNPPFAPGQLLPFQMNQMGNANSQQKGQFLPQNGVNPAQFLNQNVGFGGFPNPMQYLNQLMQLQMAMQMTNFAQVVPGSIPMYPNQGMGRQNSNFAMNNGQLGLANASGTVQQSINRNSSKQMPNATQQMQGQSPLMNSFGIVQQQQTQNFNVPGPANTQVSQGMGPQNSNFAMNAHLGPVNANGAVQQSKNALSNQMPNATQQLQGQFPMSPFGFVQQSQAQNLNGPASANTQGMGPQISNFAMNAHLGLVNANGAVQQPMNGLFQQMPVANQQLLSQLPLMNPFGFVQQPQTPNYNAPASGNMQENSYKNDFSRNQKHGAKSMKSKFGKGKFSTHNNRLKRDHHKEGKKKNIPAKSVKPEMEKTRSLLVTYSPQEIQRWREERRKNFPSKANVEKKLTEKIAESDDSSSAAKLRRQQLKEILAKQAELGCEVAEIPPSYLSDSEKLPQKTEMPPSYLSDSEKLPQKRRLSRKEKFQKKFNKRERFNRNDRFSKKRRFGNSDRFRNSDSVTTCDQNGSPAGQVTQSAREPTLLQKLLSSDIRRDKHHLLQVIRFMTMNSFFKDWPEKPLQFPRVLLKETGEGIEATEKIYDAINTTIAKSSNDSNFDDVGENNISEGTEAVSE